MMFKRQMLVAIVVSLALGVPCFAAALPVTTDSMYSDLTDAEVTARDASHSGNNAAALIAQSTRLGGGDPGQWWFSPVRGLGFQSGNPDRLNAEWDMSTSGFGAGGYRLTLTNVSALESDARDIDLFLVDSDTTTLTLISDVNVRGTLEFDFTVTASDIHGVDDIRLRAVALGGQNATLGDAGDLVFRFVSDPVVLVGIDASRGNMVFTQARNGTRFVDLLQGCTICLFPMPLGSRWMRSNAASWRLCSALAPRPRRWSFEPGLSCGLPTTTNRPICKSPLKWAAQKTPSALGEDVTPSKVWRDCRMLRGRVGHGVFPPDSRLHFHC